MMRAIWGRRALPSRHAFPATYPPLPAASSAERSSRPRSLRWFAHRPFVTITGPGGSGKTRLAIAVAAGLVADGHVGASFVDLAPVADQAQVAAAAAAAMGVREQANRPIAEVLADALSGQDLLVVIDNCEHVIDAAAELAGTLNRKCPRLRLLATSPRAARGRRRTYLQAGATVVAVAGSPLCKRPRELRRRPALRRACKCPRLDILSGRLDRRD